MEYVSEGRCFWLVLVIFGIKRLGKNRICFYRFYFLFFREDFCDLNFSRKVIVFGRSFKFKCLLGLGR